MHYHVVLYRLMLQRLVPSLCSVVDILTASDGFVVFAEVVVSVGMALPRDLTAIVRH